MGSYKECQHRSRARLEEALYPTRASRLCTKLAIDVVDMLNSEGLSKLVIVRDDFSGWPEARALRNADAKSVAKFIWEEVITRHRLFNRLLIDRGSEFKREVIAILNTYDIKRIQVSAYHAPGNRMIKRGHQSIKEALLALTSGGKGK